MVEQDTMGALNLLRKTTRTGLALILHELSVRKQSHNRSGRKLKGWEKTKNKPKGGKK